MTDLIRLARPFLNSEESDAVARVLGSGMLVQGREVEAFEREVAERCGRRFGIAVSSGTSALELALRALECDRGEVVVPALTWPSPAHAVIRNGAELVLADIDPWEWNAGPAEFSAASSAETRALIAIDQFGFPARHHEIATLGVPVIEDAACAIGARSGDRPCGSFGVIGCLSFHPRKIVTTGEGGMCLTDEPELARRIRALRNHGQSGPGRFEMASGNHRMTEMQAAMGRAQLRKLDAMLARRRELAAQYRDTLSRLVTFQTDSRSADGARDTNPNYQTLGVLLPEAFDIARRNALIERVRDEGVEIGPLSYALHRLQSLAEVRRAERLAESERVADRGVALPLHHDLTSEDIVKVTTSLERALAEVARA